MTQPGVPTTAVTSVPDDAILLDVRESDEWAAGHAPDALHIPLADVPVRMGELPAGQVHVICKSGGRSAQATALLNREGWDAVNVEGGMGAWAHAGRPMTADGDASPEVI